MPRKSWQHWLGWGLYAAALTGLGVALHEFLPTQPRFELGEETVNYLSADMLSPDGTLLSAGAILEDGKGRSTCGSIKTWDTGQGRQMGEFFRGLDGLWFGNLDEGVLEWDRGFSMAEVMFSPRRRYCALLHHGGLALADLHSGQEWPLALDCKLGEQLLPESIVVHELLQKPIPTAALHDKVKFKTALQLFSAALDNKIKIVVDRAALAAEAEKDDLDLDDVEVSLPPVPAQMIANTALRLILGQVAHGRAMYLVRRGEIEITTTSRIRTKGISHVVFSPQGSFVALVEEQGEQRTLHLVECAVGKHIASLPIRCRGSSSFGFTPDEDLLFFADAGGRPLFTIWDSRRKQVARTLVDVEEQPVNEIAPDGKTLLIGSISAGLELLELRTDQRRPLFDSKDGAWRSYFSPDGKIVVGSSAEGLQCWDALTGKKTTRIPIDFPERGWHGSGVSADSRVVCVFRWRTPDRFTAWSLQTGSRLWPPPEDRPAIPDEPDAHAIVWEGPEVSSWGFTPDHRFLIERKKDRIDFLLPASGEVHRSFTPDETATLSRLIGFTPDGRLMLSRWDYPAPAPGSVQEWLSKLMPIFRATSGVVVSDVDTGRVLLCVKGIGEGGAVLSDDGRTLLTSLQRDDNTVISCWDVPGRPPLLWVVGIPVVLGSTGVGAHWIFARRRRGRHDLARPT